MNRTKLDMIRNKIIRLATREGEISKKVQEWWFRYGHAMRREKDYEGNREIWIRSARYEKGHRGVVGQCEN